MGLRQPFTLVLKAAWVWERHKAFSPAVSTLFHNLLRPFFLLGVGCCSEWRRLHPAAHRSDVEAVEEEDDEEREEDGSGGGDNSLQHRTPGRHMLGRGDDSKDCISAHLF